MVLTYEVTSIGYTIFNDGVPWYHQETYIPYPADTMEQSAQNHIDMILKEINMSKPIDEPVKLNQVICKAQKWPT